MSAEICGRPANVAQADPETGRVCRQSKGHPGRHAYTFKSFHATVPTHPRPAHCGFSDEEGLYCRLDSGHRGEHTFVKIGGRRMAGRRTTDAVNHPDHYGGGDNPYEVIKVIRAWKMGFSLGNAIKYVARAGKKDPAKTIEDLEKAIWYIQEEIDHLRSEGSATTA